MLVGAHNKIQEKTQTSDFECIYGSTGKVDCVAVLTSGDDFSFPSVTLKLARRVFVEEKNTDKQTQEVSVQLPTTLC